MFCLISINSRIRDPICNDQFYFTINVAIRDGRQSPDGFRCAFTFMSSFRILVIISFSQMTALVHIYFDILKFQFLFRLFIHRSFSWHRAHAHPLISFVLEIRTAVDVPYRAI